jgi:hypothetical protein
VVEKEALRVMARSFAKQAGGSIPPKYFNYLLWCVEVLRKLNKIAANLPSDKPAPPAGAGVGAPAGGGSGAAEPGTDPAVLAQLAALQAELAKQRDELVETKVELAATKAAADGAENAASIAMKTAGEAHALSKTAVDTSRAAVITAVSVAALAIEAPDDLTSEEKEMHEAAKAAAKSKYSRMIKSGAVARILTGRPVGALADASFTPKPTDE